MESICNRDETLPPVCRLTDRPEATGFTSLRRAWPRAREYDVGSPNTSGLTPRAQAHVFWHQRAQHSTP